jgi:hypothetical protein
LRSDGLTECAFQQFCAHGIYGVWGTQDANVLKLATAKDRAVKTDYADNPPIRWNLNKQTVWIPAERTVVHRDSAKQRYNRWAHDEGVLKDLPMYDRVDADFVYEANDFHSGTNLCGEGLGGVGFNECQNRIAEQPYAARANARARLSACESRASIVRSA